MAGRKRWQAKHDQYLNCGMESLKSEPAEPVQVEYTPEFKRNLRALAKKYRHIRSDVQPMIDQLQAGAVMGDQVPRTRYAIFKVRVRNSDIQKSKRSGYRLIYHLKAPENIILVTIYSKLDQSDISGADSAHSDRGLVNTSHNGANVQDYKQNSSCIPALSHLHASPPTVLAPHPTTSRAHPITRLQSR